MAFRGFASPAQDPDSAQQKNSQHAEQVRDALNVQMTSAAPYSGLGKDPVQLKDHAPQPRFEVKDSRYIVSSYEEDEFGLAEDSSGMDSDRYSGHNPQEQDDFDEMDRPQYDYEVWPSE